MRDQWSGERVPGNGWCVAIIAASAIFLFAVSAWYVMARP